MLFIVILQGFSDVRGQTQFDSAHPGEREPEENFLHKLEAVWLR